MVSTLFSLHIFVGTPVTPEVFKAWYEKFMKEMGRERQEEEEHEKPSGIWILLSIMD